MVESVFLPSLEHIALVKAATQMLISPGLKKEIIEFVFHIRRKDEEYLTPYIKTIVNSIEVPINLKNSLFELMHHMIKEILQWVKIHWMIISASKGFKIFPDVFCWTHLGTIDKKKTAIRLVNIHCLPAIYRYEIASVYCLSKSVKSLYHQYGNMITQYPYYNHAQYAMSFKLVKLWSDKIIHNKEFSKSDIIQGTSTSISLGNDVSTKYFWEKLSTSEQRIILNNLHSHLILHSGIYDDVLAFLFSQMNEEQMLTFLASEVCREKLLCLLNWPHQQLFLKICELVWKLITNEEFEIFYKYWLFFAKAIIEMILKSVSNYNCLKSFYKNSPEVFKNYISTNYPTGKLINKCFESEEYDCGLILKITILLKEIGILSLTDKIMKPFCQTLLKNGKDCLAEECVSRFKVSIIEIKQFHMEVFLSIKNSLWFTDLIIGKRWTDIKHFIHWSHVSDYMIDFLAGDYNFNDICIKHILDIFSVTFQYLYELIDKIVFEFEKTEGKTYTSFEEILEIIFPNYESNKLKQFLLLCFIKHAQYKKIIVNEKLEMIEDWVEAFLKGALKINESRKKILDLKITNIRIIDLILSDIPKQFSNFVFWYLLTGTNTVDLENKITTVLKKCLVQKLFDENDLKCFINIIRNEFLPENGILKFKNEIVALLSAIYYSETNFYLNRSTFLNFCYCFLDKDIVLCREVLYSMANICHFKELLIKDNFKSLLDTSLFELVGECETLRWKKQLISSMLEDQEFEFLLYNNYFEELNNIINWCFSTKEEAKNFKKELFFHIKKKYCRKEEEYRYAIKHIDEFTDSCLTFNTFTLLTWSEWRFHNFVPFIHWSSRYNTNIEINDIEWFKLKISDHYELHAENRDDFTIFLIENCIFKYFSRNCSIKKYIDWFELSEQELKKELIFSGVISYDNDQITDIIENRIMLDNYVTCLFSFEEISDYKKTLLFHLIMSYFEGEFSESDAAKVNRLIDICFLSDSDKIVFKKKCIFCFESNHLPLRLLQSTFNINTIDFYISVFLFNNKDICEFKEYLFQHINLKLNAKSNIIKLHYNSFELIKGIINWFCLPEEINNNYKKEILNNFRDRGFLLDFIFTKEFSVIDGFLSWCLPNYFEIQNFKPSIFDCAIYGNNERKITFIKNSDNLPLLFNWCKLTANQIKSINEQLMGSLMTENGLRPFVCPNNELYVIEPFMNWVFDDQEEIRNIKKCLLSTLIIYNSADIRLNL